MSDFSINEIVYILKNFNGISIVGKFQFEVPHIPLASQMPV